LFVGGAGFLRAFLHHPARQRSPTSASVCSHLTSEFRIRPEPARKHSV
jgi:hypothetical protein